MSTHTADQGMTELELSMGPPGGSREDPHPRASVRRKVLRPPGCQRTQPLRAGFGPCACGLVLLDASLPRSEGRGQHSLPGESDVHCLTNQERPRVHRLTGLVRDYGGALPSISYLAGEASNSA
ncbi:hypothetical protein GCM10023317_54640 [Actinopolymorpha pittospori]